MLTFSSNLKQVLSALDRFEGQIPFAAAMALNDTADEVGKAEEKAVAASLDRPTPFTQRAIYKTRASKTKLSVEVGIRKIQGGYLVWQIEGGVRGPKRKAIPVPVGVVRNANGNMRKGAIAKMLSRPDVFVASSGASKTKHLAPGIYQRGSLGKRKSGERGSKGDNWQGRGKKRSSLKMLVSFEDSATYRMKRFDFFGIGTKKAEEVFRDRLEHRLAEAIATAR